MIKKIAAVLVVLATISNVSYAQRRGGRGGDSGGDRGDRGADRGDRGGGRGGRGGDRGGDRGGGFPFGGRGGDSPFGGRGGGFPFGGRGGDSPFGGRGGGFPGGRGGDSPFGGRGGGGFNPTFLIERLDANRDGRLSGEELEGRGRFMLERFAPGLDLSRSVSVRDVVRRIEQGRDGDDRGRGGRDSSDPSDIEPLVPGFGVEMDLAPVQGFGTLAEFFAVKPNEEDRGQAERTIERYDRNRDGKLDRREIERGRWSDDPDQFDRNKDGNLTKDELAVRYARRRLAGSDRDRERDRDRSRDRQDDRSGENDRRGDFRRGGDRGWWGRGGDEEEGGEGEGAESEAAEPEETAVSYRFRSAHERLPAGLPAWFRGKDLNKDGQIAMAEYAAAWSADLIDQFMRLDHNRDGFITAQECIAGPSSAASGTVGKVAAATAPASGSGASTDGASSAAENYANGLLNKYDVNGDGQLSTSDEWKNKAADVNGDGTVDRAELIKWAEG